MVLIEKSKFLCSLHMFSSGKKKQLIKCSITYITCGWTVTCDLVSFPSGDESTPGSSQSTSQKDEVGYTAFHMLLLIVGLY